MIWDNNGVFSTPGHSLACPTRRGVIMIAKPSYGTLGTGKHTKNYGKSQFLMGKSTKYMAVFNSYVGLPKGLVDIPGISLVKPP